MSAGSGAAVALHLPVTRELFVPPDHPSFAGHFPQRPLLPGALLLSEVLEAVRSAPELAFTIGASPTFANAKFLAPVEPGDHLHIDLAPVGASRPALEFTVRRGDLLLAKGRLVGDAPA